MVNVIFDLDGTLIHSAPDLHAAANKMLKSMALAPLSEAQIIAFIGNGVPKLVERCLAVYNQPTSSEAVATYRELYDADPYTLTRPYPGAVACLQALKAAGGKLAICTNKPEAPAKVILDGLGLTPYFDFIVGGDTYPTMKPDPAPLLGCAEALGGEAIYVGDSETDEQTATNANMTFALFEGGYRKTPVSEMRHHLAFTSFEVLTRFVDARSKPELGIEHT